MTRRALLAALPSLAAAATLQDADGRILTFHHHWDKFLRTFLGCPKGATSSEQCNPTLGGWDYPEFVKAAKIGRELFSLDKK